MRLGVSVKRLRWGLLASATLLVGLLVVFLSYGRFRLHSIEQKIRDRVAHTFNEGLTYSDSVGGKINYTLHADKMELKPPTGNGHEVYILHGVEMDLYGRTSGGTDHVYGKDFEYDKTDGTVKALGDVDMDIQAPTSVGGQNAKPARDASGKPVNIHVKTSGLVYVKKLGVAATSERVEFSYGAIHGSSQGAEFDNGSNVLRLLAQVEASGDEHGQPMHLTAAKADFDRTGNIATFADAVVNSGVRTARANNAMAYLRHDSSVERLVGVGGVVLSQGTRKISASHLESTFSTNTVVQWMKLSGGVALLDASAQRPMHGGAQEAEISFDAKGTPAKVTAHGGVHVLEIDHRAGTPAQGLRRSMSGDEVTMSFVSGMPRGGKSKSILHQLRAIGNAKTLGDSWSANGKEPAQLKTTELDADDLQGDFVEDTRGEAALKTVHGNGHALLQQDSSTGAQQVSTGDTLDAVMSAGAATSSRVESAVLNGHVTIHSKPVTKPGAKTDVTTATADRANYDGSSENLRLTGDAHVKDGSTEMSAATILVDQPTGNAEADGGVVASVMGSGARPNATQDSSSAQVTHVLAASAKLQHAAKQAEFHGTDAQPAKLWQGASQVEAANLFLDGDKHTLAARPAANGAVIHAVFASANASTNPTTAPKPNTTNKPAGNSVVRVTAEKMDYADGQRESTLVGRVRMDGLSGDVTSQRAVVFLTPAKAGTNSAAPFAGSSGSVDHVVFTGDVRLEQPGRRGTGDTLLYTAGNSRYVMTGTPGHLPQAVDAQQGTVTGTTLIFSDAGSTIIVAGEPATSKGKGTRIRTETEVRPEGKK